MTTIDAQLAVVGQACATLLADLDGLLQLLGPADSGTELTPDQYQRLADSLADVGLLGAAILTADLARTARREGRA